MCADCVNNLILQTLESSAPGKSGKQPRPSRHPLHWPHDDKVTVFKYTHIELQCR